MTIQRVEIPTALPGCCMLCGSGDREFFIDLGRQEEFYGAQYVCDICIGHLGDLAGFPSPARLGTLERELAEAKDHIFELSRKLDGLEKVQDGLLALGVELVGSESSNSTMYPVADEDIQQADGAEQGEGSEHDSGAGTVDESSDDEGLAELSEPESEHDFLSRLRGSTDSRDE